MNGEEWRKRICMETDTGYSYSLAKRMEKYRTNPVLGYRTAGSRAEFETGEMLVREMAVSYTHLTLPTTERV